MNAVPLRGIRLPHPAWLAPLLLPALPLLAAARETGWLRPDAALPACLLLLLGVALAAAVPGWLSRAGWRWRKEAEQLRPAWLAALFTAPAPLLLGGGEATQFAMMFFVVTCALVASVPFGMEFQQRTLAGLLSQPVERREVWRIKMSVLAAAVLTHVAAFMLALGITGAESPAEGPGLLILLAAVVLCTTPWWTLRTRSLIAGLVFSVAAPLVVLALLALAVDLMFAGEDLSAAARFETWAFRGAFWVAAPVYALAGAWLGCRRWLRLEAIEAESAAVAGLFQRRSSQTTARRRSAMLQLAGKEVRLHAVAWGVSGLAALFALVTLARDWNGDTREALTALTAMLGALTVLLAGATCIAEERRLGTLDGQLLQPVSRARQWWLKLLLAAAPAALAVFAAVTAALGFHAFTSPDEATLMNLLIVGGFVSGGFLAAVLASSASPNALRALIAGVVLFFAGAAVIGVAVAFSDRALHWVVLEPMPGVYLTGRLADGTDLLERAAALTPEEVEGLRAERWPTDRPGFWAVPGVLLWLVVLGAALACAWRNFASPAGASGRLLRQGAVVLGTLALGVAAFGGSRLWQIQASEERSLLLQARGHLTWLQHLPPAQRDLYRRQATGRLFPSISVPLKPEAPSGGTSVGPRPPAGRSPAKGFTLPLKPADLAFILERGDLPADLLEALRREAEAGK